MITRDHGPAAQSTRRRTRTAGTRSTLVIGGLAALATTVAASGGDPAPPPPVQNRATHIIEWNLPAPADASPGAMIVDTRGHDNNRVWFVTRLGSQRVVRLDPNRSLMKANAQWTSWELSPDSVQTGGSKKIKASRDRRFVFVRAATSLQRIDTGNCDNASTKTCERVEWFDQPGSTNVSDLAVDDYNNVFTTAAVSGSVDDVQPALADSYVQRLTPGTAPANGVLATGGATVTRWKVGGGAGFCADLGSTTTSFPCLSGIAVHPSNNQLIYYSEPEGGPDGRGAIGELNVQTSAVRRWAFATIPPDPDGGVVQQPRQLHIDRFGKVWVITGSGHMVSLDPCTNRMTRHAIPNAVLADPFGLAPDDDVVGYTDAGVSTARVGMMVPAGTSLYIPPTSAPVEKTTVAVDVMGERASVASGAVQPQGFVVPVTVTTKPDGIFVEAQIGANGGHDSESPLGITANKGKGQGTFFYAVGLPGQMSVDRVGFVRLPMPKKVKHPRDDDDPDDGFDHNQHASGWHTHQAEDGDDDDDDGLDPVLDLPTANENVADADTATIGPAQYTDYTVTASSGALALIAVAKSDDLASMLAVDVYNALGTLVASSPVMPGAATATVTLPAPGAYKARVRNMGISSLTETPVLIVREPRIP